MTTNQTIYGVPRDLIEDALAIATTHATANWSAAVRDKLRALLDKEVSGDSRAPQHQGEQVAIVLPEFEPAFEKWWEEYGQYCRAGGGSYEKTFAYRAYEAALAEVTRLNTK